MSSHGAGSRRAVCKLRCMTGGRLLLLCVQGGGKASAGCLRVRCGWSRHMFVVVVSKPERYGMARCG
jgi:hypothetical protein